MKTVPKPYKRYFEDIPLIDRQLGYWRKKARAKLEAIERLIGEYMQCDAELNRLEREKQQETLKSASPNTNRGQHGLP